MVYRTVSECLWADAGFLALSDRGKLLWLFLLTGPHNRGVPGLFRLSKPGAADELGWTADELQACWDELQAAGLKAEADWDNRVVLLPKALDHNGPANASVVVGFFKRLAAIPECSLRQKWLQLLEDHCEQRGVMEWFTSATHRVGHRVPHRVGHPTQYSRTKGVPVQEQEQDQEQEQEEEVARRAPLGPSQAPAPASVEAKKEREDERRLEWQRMIDDLVEWAKGQRLPDNLVPSYVHAAEQGLAEYHEARSGALTWTRRADLARRLRRVATKGPRAQADAQRVWWDVPLYAMEIYADRYAGAKDHRYLAKIAENMARDLTEKQMDAEMDAHRKRNPAGVFAQVFNHGER